MLIGIDASRATAAQRTGTENYTVHLVRALVEMGSAHQFRLYLSRLPEDGLLPQGENVEWRVIPFPRLWTHARLAWEVRADPPDVLFVPAHVLPLVHPPASVATVHDLGYFEYPQAHRAASRWYLNWATRHNARHARLVVVDSQATARDLMRYYGTPPDRIRVAYPAATPGLAPVRDEPALDAVRERYGTGKAYFLYVGTLQPRKNLARLVRAFADLVSRDAVDSQVKLVLAGRRGWLYDEIVATARERCLEGRVVLPGFVAQEDLAALLSGALAFVFPSLYEGFGLPVLEAMACEVPVICSDTSSLPEVAGDAALLVDPHDTAALAGAMARVYSDPGLAEELVRRGRERAQRFSWEECARSVLLAMEEAAAQTGTAEGRPP